MTATTGTPNFHLLLSADRTALVAGHPTALRVLARVQAPGAPAAASPRRPLHFALVLDRSGSMSGAPLEEAKRCARHIVDSLAPGDRAAVFAFDDEVARVAPLTPATAKLALSGALATIQSGGTTNLYGGWRAGADELAANLAGDDLHRVILLSDGCANEGETRPETIAAECKALAQRGVTTSTYGLGNNFNEALMLAMAGAGRGNAYYGRTAADLAEPFAAEFALLANLCARGLVLKVHAPADVRIRLRNDYERVDGDELAWRLPDLAFASEAWALLEMTIEPVPAVEAPVALPVTVSVQAKMADGTPMFLMASLPGMRIVERAEWDALPPDPLVARRVLELDAADALAEVRAAIEADDWSRAQKLVDTAATRFAGHEWAAAILATMKRLVAKREKSIGLKESMYAARQMRGRLAALAETEFDAAAEANIPAFLRRKDEQGKGRREP